MTALGSEVAGVGLDVGFLCHRWAPSVGGIESHGRELARALGALGHRVHVLCLEDPNGAAPWSVRDEVVDGVPVRRMAYAYHDHRTLADLVTSPRATEVVMDWAAEVPCDVHHVHHLTGFGTGALEALADMGRPVVLTLHDYWPLCPRGQMVHVDGSVCEVPEPERCGACLAATWPHLSPDADAAAARTERALAALALPHRLFATSAAVAERYVRAGVAQERVVLEEPGVDAEEIARRTAAERERAPRGAGALVVGVLGAVQPTKGVLELVRAFGRAAVPGLELELHGPLPSWHGSDAYARAVREAVEATPGAGLFDAYPAAELPRVLARLDAVAAPSLWNEAFGLGVREARAAGLPVLVSDRGGLPAAAEDGAAGLVLPAGDERAWSEALVRFATEPDLRARWSAAPFAGRTVAASARSHEARYLSAFREVTGEEPALGAPDAAGPERRPEPRPGLLRRLFGR